MKTFLSGKSLSQRSLAGALVVLIAVMAYLGFAARSSRPAVRRVPPAASVPGRATVVPPALPPGVPAGSATALQAPRTPSVALASATAPSPTPGPAGTPSNGKPPSAAPAAATPDPEAAVVGTGPRGRTDPFSPLVIQEPQRAAPGTPLPPLPGVGLPMPPGFAAPGGTPGTPGTPAAPVPGSGMRVTGIMGSRQRVAIIDVKGQTYIVAAGERIGDAVVVSILSDKVVLKQNNVTFELGFGGDRSL